MKTIYDTPEERYGVLDFPCGAERLANGDTLIADAGDEIRRGSEIIQVDRNGQIVWSYTENLIFAHSAQRLPNGNTLITDTTHNRVIEVTYEKEVVFDSNLWGGGTGKLSDGSHLSYPNDAHVMSDGNLIITDRNNDRCVIADKAGKMLWQYSEGIKHPHNADPLPNGNVIIADSDQNRIIEVNRDKRIVWSYGDKEGHEKLAWPRDADRLENGNTLICDSKNSRVFEVDPKGKLVWNFVLPYFANVYDADPLPNGNVLIVDQQHQRILEVDRFGGVQWVFRNYRPALVVQPRLTNGFFKRRDKRDEPEGWVLLTRTSEGGGKIIWSEGEQGKTCVGMEYDRSAMLCLFQLVAVKPGQTYRLGATFKAEGLEEGAIACLQFAFRDRYGGLFEDVLDSPKGTLYEGSTDWVEDSVEALAPEEATAVEIRILMTGRGRVWIRQVMMIEG